MNFTGKPRAAALGYYLSPLSGLRTAQHQNLRLRYHRPRCAARSPYLAGSLLGQKKYADAEPLLLSGYKGMLEHAAEIPAQAQPRLIEALERLVQLYDAWGKPDEATKWRAKLPKSPKSKNNQ